MAQEQEGISPADAARLKVKLNKLHESVEVDQAKFAKQEAELGEKQRALDTVYVQMHSIRKQLMVTGGALTEPDFRKAVGNSLKEIRAEVDHLSFALRNPFPIPTCEKFHCRFAWTREKKEVLSKSHCACGGSDTHMYVAVLENFIHPQRTHRAE